MTEPWNKFNYKKEFLEFVLNREVDDCEFLTKNQRYIVNQRILKEKTFREIADELKMSGTNARVQFISSHNKVIRHLKEKQPITSETLIGDTPLKCRHALSYIGIEKVSDLQNFSFTTLLEFRHIGEAAIREIEQFIDHFGMKLLEEPKTCEKMEKVQVRQKLDLILNEIESLKELIKTNLTTPIQQIHY